MRRIERRTTRRRPANQSLSASFLVFLVFAYMLVAPLLSHASSPASDACREAVCAAQTYAAVDRITVSSPPGPAICPYCDQDPDRWLRLTAVAPPKISGLSAALVEGSCARLIYGLSPNERRPPASIAKIVSALVVAEHGRLNDRVDIKLNGWDLAVAGGSSIAGLLAGTNLSVEELLYALLLPSGNDAALALADYVGGPARFADLMNEAVASRGLKNSHFANPDGRDAPANYTSALDIALLGRDLMADPGLRTIVGTKTRPASWDGHLLWNTNYLVYGYSDAVGIKFGYTEAAKETIVGAASRGGRELYVSVLASDFAYLDAVKLLDWAYTRTSPAC